MTRVLVVGDLHGKIPKGIPTKDLDLILLTGDLGKADLARKRFFENLKRKNEGLEELEEDNKFKRKVHQEIHESTIKVLRYFSKYAPVYTLQGNVRIATDSDVKEAYEKGGLRLVSTSRLLSNMKGATVVKNRLRVFGNLRVGFLEYFTDTSWVREFKPSGYKKSMKKAKDQTDKSRRVLGRFGKDLDILVSHQPPQGILDKVNFPGVPDSWKGKHAGSKAILDYIKKFQPRYAFCGHIHEGEGHKKIGRTEVYNLGCGGWKVFDL
jgi:Icc-related predicted phosphoesterase